MKTLRLALAAVLLAALFVPNASAGSGTVTNFVLKVGFYGTGTSFGCEHDGEDDVIDVVRGDPKDVADFRVEPTVVTSGEPTGPYYLLVEIYTDFDISNGEQGRHLQWTELSRHDEIDPGGGSAREIAQIRQESSIMLGPAAPNLPAPGQDVKFEIYATLRFPGGVKAFPTAECEILRTAA